MKNRWSPEWAPHVQGEYEDREVDPATGLVDPQKFAVACTFPGCSGKWQGSCTSGAVRQHIARFAALHLHRDPFQQHPPHLSADPNPAKPGR